MSHYYRASAPNFSSRQDRMWRRNQNTAKFAPSVNLGPISHTILIALMVAVLGLIYLTQVVKTGAYGYDINSLDEKLATLQSKKKDLVNENARLQALSNVAESSVAKAMKSPAATEYAQN